jgi:hypothetical protein
VHLRMQQQQIYYCISPYGWIKDRFLCHQWMLHL